MMLNMSFRYLFRKLSAVQKNDLQPHNFGSTIQNNIEELKKKNHQLRYLWFHCDIGMMIFIFYCQGGGIFQNTALIPMGNQSSNFNYSFRFLNSAVILHR